ncbi:choice-of-anchor Q domain-containing protein [Persephonella sp.]
MKKTKVLNAVFFIGLTFSTSFGATFNVSNEQELFQALATASNNGEDDVINISPGVYNIKNVGSNNFKYEAKSTENYSLTIVGAGIDKTIIEGKNSTGSILYISSNGNGNVTVKNLTIKGGETTFTDLYGTSNFPGGGLYLSIEGNILIENVKLTHNSAGMSYGGGAYVRSGNGDITIRNSIFYRNVGMTGAGVYITIGDSWKSSSTGSLYLYNNVFYENGGYQGVGFYVAPNTTGDLNIINNTVMGNVIFKNNSPSTSYGAGGYIFLNGQSGKVNVINNIFWKNENDARSSVKVSDLFYDNSQGNPDFNLFNNVIDPNNTDSFAIRYTTQINLGQNIYTDPQLSNPSNLNFLPQKGSPVIDKGEDSVVNFNTDFGGNNRKVDGDGDGKATVDIGALEYSKNASSLPPGSSGGGGLSNISGGSGGGGGCNLGNSNVSNLLILLTTAFLAIYRITSGGRKNEVA